MKFIIHYDAELLEETELWGELEADSIDEALKEAKTDVEAFFWGIGARDTLYVSTKDDGLVGKVYMPEE